MTYIRLGIFRRVETFRRNVSNAAWRTEEIDDLILAETAEKMLSQSKMVGNKMFAATLEKLANWEN
ncbi:hypothetical protein H1P_200012 [Hyella patelloides LEGE 07179]|uniref:Uncharacterized protein n=1 Tax=Hyella patelloides LEGE 07179 TaxID=945734 RepID=A0A563VPZ6_9CYAN|nr:hypothetical protein H1P_200012 [Hyella patelloides LEGE 07179]